jgi:hypothetical protein
MGISPGRFFYVLPALSSGLLAIGDSPALVCAIPIFWPSTYMRIRLRYLVHIPKFRNGTGKILANASTPDFSGASDIILGYALSAYPKIPQALKLILGYALISSLLIWT